MRKNQKRVEIKKIEREEKFKRVKAFKNELLNYTYYLERRKILDEKIKLEYYKLSGVSAINPSKMPGSTNELLKNLSKLEIYGKIDNLKNEYNRNEVKLLEIQEVLKKLDENQYQVLSLIYFKKKKIKDICQVLGVENIQKIYRMIDVWLFNIL